MKLGATPDNEPFIADADRFRGDRQAMLLSQATAVTRQLRQLLNDQNVLEQPELRLALADELIQEIEILGLGLQRPAVRQATARVRRALGLPVAESSVPMSLDTALAFLSLAINPPDEMVAEQPG